MHWVALLPHRLFMTTYRPPIVVDPYWSQISVSAWAAGATPTAGAAMPAAASMATDRACLSFMCRLHFVVLPAWERSQVSCPDETTVKPSGKEPHRDQFST